MQETMEVSKVAQEVSDKQGLEIDVNVYRDEAQMCDIIHLRRDVEYLDGTEDTYKAQVSVSDRMRHDDDIDLEEYIMRDVEGHIRNLKEQAAERMNVNGHSLIFYMQNGFHAVSRETGKEFIVEPEEYEHATATISFGEVEEPLDQSRTDVFTQSPEIPMHVKEKLMMYVVGWANTYSPDEYLTAHRWEDARQDGFDRKI